MVSAGILLKGSLIRIVTLSGTRQRHVLIAPKVNKMELPKNPDKDDVEAFVQALTAYCSDNAVDLVTINARPTAGQGAGGAATFRTEGILLATLPCPVQGAYPATLAASHRREGGLKILRPETQDLGKAYDLAFEGLG